MILLACQLSLLQKASVWMESGLRSAIQKEVLIFIVEDISSDLFCPIIVFQIFDGGIPFVPCFYYKD